MYKSIIIIIFILITSMTLSSCQTTSLKTDGKLQVVTTLFPIYDFTKQIAQDKADVTLILPPGVEPHTYDPTPRDIFQIRNADLFIYTGDFMEPWAAKVINVFDSKESVITSSANVTLLTTAEENHSDSEEGQYDPHIWLNPLNAIIMVDNITQGLIDKDPDNQTFYETNAANYKQQLVDLNDQFVDLFNHTTYHTIIYGGHFVFGYFAKQYNIDFISPYSGFAPDAEPTPQSIQDLIKVMKSTGQNVVYYEELIEPKVASVIAEETGASMLLLNGVHNVSKVDLKNNVTYLSIMQQNIENLKIGLGYHE